MEPTLNQIIILVLHVFLLALIVTPSQIVPPVPILFITTTLPAFPHAQTEPSRILPLAHFVIAPA